MFKVFNKEYRQKLKKAMHLNVFGIECPDCCTSEVMSNQALTARVFLTKNSGVYIKCKVCKLTTPVFNDFGKVIECWEDYLIAKETDLLLGKN